MESCNLVSPCFYLQESFDNLYKNEKIISFQQTAKLIGLVKTIIIVKKMYLEHRKHQKNQQENFVTTKIKISNTKELNIYLTNSTTHNQGSKCVKKKKNNSKTNSNQSQPANLKQEFVVQIQELKKMLDSAMGSGQTRLKTVMQTVNA